MSVDVELVGITKRFGAVARSTDLVPVVAALA